MILTPRRNKCPWRRLVASMLWWMMILLLNSSLVVFTLGATATATAATTTMTTTTATTVAVTTATNPIVDDDPTMVDDNPAIGNDCQAGPCNRTPYIRHLWYAHATLMSVSFMILIPSAIMASLIRNLLPAVNLGYKLHLILNGTALILIVCGFCIAVYIVRTVLVCCCFAPARLSHFFGVFCYFTRACLNPFCGETASLLSFVI
jgi:hypothetical protein